MAEVKFVCVNFNGAMHTINYVQSVRSQTIESEIVVVDNNSCQEDIDLIESSIVDSDSFKIIKSGMNIGYFGGLNLGIDRKSAQYLVVGNNDLCFSKDFVEKLLNEKYPSDVLVVAPNVITADGYNQNPHCRNRVGSFRKFLYRLYFMNYPFAKLLTAASRIVSRMKGGRDNTHDQQPGYIHLGIGACYILLPSFFQHFDKLDDSVFLYGEEAMLAGQLMKVNGRIYYDPTLVVHHAESATLSNVPSKTKYEFMKSSYPKYRDYL